MHRHRAARRAQGRTRMSEYNTPCSRKDCAAQADEIARLRDDLRREREVFSMERERLQRSMDALMDPILRAKMLEPPPPMIIKQEAPALRAAIDDAVKRLREQRDAMR